MWLCLHLPRCALEAPARYLPAGEAPTVVVASERGLRQVVAANDAALQHGVRAGQWLTAARARAPGLVAWSRDPGAEDTLLRQLAGRCLNVTSHVHRPAPPPEWGAGRLLLEVGGSLRLFGGWDGLIQAVRDLLAEAGYDALLGAGRTPGLAMLRARGRAHGYRGTKTAALPLTLLELPGETLDSLSAAGLATIGEVLRLPRDGLARRYGPDCLAYLDRLTGRATDPRPALAPPQRFGADLELPAEITETQALCFPLHRLIDDLAAMLRGADAAIATLRLSLHHAESRPTHIDLGLAAPARDAARLNYLLAERLDSLQLHAPVRSLRLASGRFLAFVPDQLDLFADRAHDAAAWHELLDRLNARLGEAALRQPQCQPEHRPERAARLVEVGSVAGEPAATDRPAWLLPAPQYLPQPPRLLGGPERIESGWWETDQCRDYYVGCDDQGRRVWVYRQVRPPHRWYLHGVFG